MDVFPSFWNQIYLRILFLANSRNTFTTCGSVKSTFKVKKIKNLGDKILKFWLIIQSIWKNLQSNLLTFQILCTLKNDSSFRCCNLIDKYSSYTPPSFSCINSSGVAVLSRGYSWQITIQFVCKIWNKAQSSLISYRTNHCLQQFLR